MSFSVWNVLLSGVESILMAYFSYAENFVALIVSLATLTSRIFGATALVVDIFAPTTWLVIGAVSILSIMIRFSR